MPVPRSEEMPVSPAVEGDLAVSRLALTGWSQRLARPAGAVSTTTRATDDGRVWIALSGTTLTVYRDGPTSGTTFDSGAAVASGTVSSGVVTMTASNTSGITGSADVPSGASGYVRALVSYADENDTRRYMLRLTELLDGSSQWEGGVRFELALLEAFRRLNGWVLNRMPGTMAREASGRFDLTQNANPGALRDVQAMLTAEILLRNRAAAGRTIDLDLADAMEERASREFDRIRIEIDEELDGTIEAEALGITTIRRG